MAGTLGPKGTQWAPNGIGVYAIGVNPIGTRPFNPWQTILSQYANSPTIVQLIINMSAYFDPSANIDSFFDNLWNVNTAVGYGLDVWGRIVGVGRVLEISSTNFFGFTGPSGASGLPWNQAPFNRLGNGSTSNFALLDAPYRALVLAKALFNICDGTIPAINQIMVFLFGPNGPLAV